MTTLSLIASKKVFEIVGEYETEKSWCVAKEGGLECSEPMDIRSYEDEYLENWKEIIPAPTFSELIRVLPKIGEKKGWCELHNGEWYWFEEKTLIMHLAMLYALAPTEPEGMQAVEEYLLNLL